MGMFPDPSMADQVIHHLYRYAWNDIVKGTGDPLWFDTGVFDVIKRQGFDVWAVDDMNSDVGIFFKRSHDLWNQVPPSAVEMKYTQETV